MRTRRFVINERSCSDRPAGARGCGPLTGCSGRGSVTCGPDGGERSSSSSPTPFSGGIDEGVGAIGAGRVGRADPVGHASRAPFKCSSARCATPTPTWGAPRIHGELLKLGIAIAEATVGHYMVRRRPPPSQTWRTFLTNHIGQLVSVDFFVVPTLTFRVLFVFVVLAHDRRQILHVNVTGYPTAAWTAQQIRNAFPWDTAPRFLLRDRDGTYGHNFRACLEAMEIDEVLTAPQSPWQNPYVDRLIGSMRRECVDHVIVLNERSLHRILRSYIDYYHLWRTHLSLGKDAPVSRRVEPAAPGEVMAMPHVGGLHHSYHRHAA